MVYDVLHSKKDDKFGPRLNIC